MEISLDGLRIGQQAVVTRIQVRPALVCRLRDLGMVCGTCVSPRYRTPCGKVTALDMRGSVVALRTTDMAHIWVRC